MRFATFDDKLIEAEPGLKGFCRGCGKPVIPQCGPVRIRHWSHQKTKMCDAWWEAETDWHRAWKNEYQHRYQEVFMLDVINGEKHIADVRTDYGLVIEFQHSPLSLEELIAREMFYQNMVWVVNGTRLKHDYTRFLKGQKRFESMGPKRIFRVSIYEDCFPAAWINCQVPVIFDFLEVDQTNNEEKRNPLYCLLPNHVGHSAIVVEIPRKAFIKMTINGKWSERVASLMERLDQMHREYKRWSEVTPFNFNL